MKNTQVLVLSWEFPDRAQKCAPEPDDCGHNHHGVGMLAEQAAEAFEWWRGVRPNTLAGIEKLTVAPV